jgi:uncharacterized membrane protein
MQDLGSQEFNGAAFDGYTLDGFQPGEELTLSLKGRNPATGGGFSLSADASNLWVGIIGLAVAIFAVMMWLRREEVDANDNNEDVEDSPESIMDEIIALDEAYEAGEVNEKKYEKERAALKDALRKLMEMDS